MNRTARQFIQRATRGPWQGMEAEAKALLARRERTPRDAKLPQSVKVKEAATAERERATAERCSAEYAKVAYRAGHRCELTDSVGSDLDPVEIHHIFYGKGVDRDSVTFAELMVQVRRSVHQRIHRSPLTWAPDLKGWASSHGYTRAYNEIERRCERARAAAPEREDAK